MRSWMWLMVGGGTRFASIRPWMLDELDTSLIVRSDALPEVYFFFQAEDGIRDYKVTGVQTCALPICGVDPQLLTRARGALLGLVIGNQLGVPTERLGTAAAIRNAFPQGVRDLARPPDRKSVV